MSTLLLGLPSKGRLQADAIAWFAERGFPPGRLGELMEVVHEVKTVGADEVFAPLRAAQGGRTRLRKKRPKRVDFD